MLNTVKHLRIVRVVVHVSVRANVRNFQIAELDSLDGVAVELVYYLCIAEDGLDTGFIADAG